MNDRLHRVVGIDLGTTYSAVAAYNSYSDSPEIIYDPVEGNPRGAATPSVVALNRSRQIIVGEEAKRTIASDPENTVIEIKREMGERFTEELLDKFGARGVFRVGDPNDPINNPSDPVKVFFRGEWFLPQEISALILMRMKQVAEVELGGEIHDAVVTVPAYFTEPRTAATKEAALLAGMYPRQLIPEPTAAAICYGVDTAQLERKVYLVYDLGGGTFDVSIIVAQEGRIDVIATSGDPRLGGGDFDDAIVEWVLPRVGVVASANPGLVRKIKAAVEIAKRDLSLNETTEIVLPPLADGQAPPPAMPLDRATFESLIETTLRTKSLAYVDDAINAAGIARDAIDAVLLVGGSTRIPLVKRMLVEHFGRAEEFVNDDADPDTVVARGAAIVARRFDPSGRFVIAEQPDATLVNRDVADELEINLIADHTLGVGIQDNRVDPLILRGSNVPYKVTKADYTNPPNATNVRCVIYQGEGEYAFNHELVGIIELGEIDPQPEGHHRFEVTFSLDLDGLLDVRVKHLNTNNEYQAKFEQNVRIGTNEALAARRSLLEQLYDREQLGKALAAPVEAPPAEIPPPVAEPVPDAHAPSAAAPPMAEPPPVPAQEPAPSEQAAAYPAGRETKLGPDADAVDCSVYAPPSAVPGDALLVQVFAHTAEQTDAATALAQEFDLAAKRRGFASLPLEVEEGVRLTFDLRLPGLMLAEPVQSLVWRRRPASVQFAVRVPDDQNPGPVIGTVTISQGGIPVGHIKFRLEIAHAHEVRGRREPQPVGDDVRRYKTAFVSYASQDRPEVLRRVQMLGPLGIQYSVDVLGLDPGDRWERKLYEHIDECDLFLLFWSSGAKSSDWVKKEVEYAVARKGGDDFAPPEIRPIIIDGPPVVPPWEELAHLHFNDVLVYLIAADDATPVVTEAPAEELPTVVPRLAPVPSDQAGTAAAVATAPIPAAATAAAPPAGPALVEIQAEVPAEFKATVRRVQRFLLQEPDERLVTAFNAFAAGLNAGAEDDRLEELGDELADVFDDVRLHLR